MSCNIIIKYPIKELIHTVYTNIHKYIGKGCVKSPVRVSYPSSLTLLPHSFFPLTDLLSCLFYQHSLNTTCLTPVFTSSSLMTFHTYVSNLSSIYSPLHVFSVHLSIGM